MHRLIRSSQSDEDLIALWQYIATTGKNPDSADGILREIDRRIEFLPRHPHLGEAQPQFGDRTRRIIVATIWCSTTSSTMPSMCCGYTTPHAASKTFTIEEKSHVSK